MVQALKQLVQPDAVEGRVAPDDGTYVQHLEHCPNFEDDYVLSENLWLVTDTRAVELVLEIMLLICSCAAVNRLQHVFLRRISIQCGICFMFWVHWECGTKPGGTFYIRNCLMLGTKKKFTIKLRDSEHLGSAETRRLDILDFEWSKTPKPDP